jgi:hypothetical protein
MPSRAGITLRRSAAVAKSAMDGNSQSGVTAAGGWGVAPQPGLSCRRLIHTVGSPAFFAGGLLTIFGGLLTIFDGYLSGAHREFYHPSSRSRRSSMPK